MASQISSHGVLRSTWCIWYRSMWSVPSRRSDSSQALRILKADRKRSLGHSPLPPYSFVASTVRSRRPPPAAIHRPMTDSVTPSARGWP